MLWIFWMDSQKPKCIQMLQFISNCKFFNSDWILSHFSYRCLPCAWFGHAEEPQSHNFLVLLSLVSECGFSSPAEFISWEVIFVHFAQCLVHLVRHSDLKSCEWSWVLHTETVWNCQGGLTKQRLGKSWLAWLTEPNKGFILTAQGCWGSEHVWTWCPTRLQLRESISTHEAIHQRASEVNWHQCRQHDAVRQEGWNQYYKSMISQIWTFGNGCIHRPWGPVQV